MFRQKKFVTDRPLTIHPARAIIPAVIIMPDDAYTGFAQVYDRFMSDIPYKKWLAFIKKTWAENGQKPRLVLDLACGTGTFTKLLEDEGFDVIGLDASPDMLAAARQKLPGALLTCQDIRRFELYGTVDAAVCLCDSVNYLRSAADLRAMLACVSNYLNPGGLFVFDIKTIYEYENMFGAKTFAEEVSDAAYIWSNKYDPARRINTYKLDFWQTNEWHGKKVLVPSGGRTSPCNSGNDKYMYNGGQSCNSWAIPYLCGVFALSLQIEKNLSYNDFCETAKMTAAVNNKGLFIIDPKQIISQTQKGMAYSPFS